MITYTFFVVNLTTMVFITLVYGFAFRFLRNRFYLGLSLGWLLNTLYLFTEVPKALLKADGQGITETSSQILRNSLFTVALGTISSLIFHLSTKLTPDRYRKSSAIIRPLVMSGVPFTVLLIGAAVTREVLFFLDLPIAFALLSLPAALYSSLVLMLIAARFQNAFPEEEFGYASRLLYGSWAAYSLLQLTYPLKLTPQLTTFIAAAFALALSVKMLGLVGLLNVLRQYYESAQDQSRHASVLADLGNVAAGLHHDIATPLASIDSELEMLSRQKHSDRTIAQFLDKVSLPMESIYAALKVIDLARLDPESNRDDVVPASARDIVHRSINLFRGQFPQAPLDIFTPGDTRFFIQANPEMLSQAFVNIIKNSNEAGATHLVIRINKASDSPHKISFLFQNNGTSLSPEEQRNCLKPGWSSKRKREGRANVGMGLYMASKYVALHRGSLRIRNREGREGVEVVIEVPGAKSRRGES